MAQQQISPSRLLSFTQSPGAQYILVNANRILTECYAGVANIANSTPVTETTTFNAFSITKTVTAAAVLKLAAEKRILLKDYASPLLNEFHFTYPFTIQQLLCHQAGFIDPIPISWIHLAEEKQFNEGAFIKQVIDKNAARQLKPGTKFNYSSIGYLMLSLIIERVSGQPYHEFIKSHVLPAYENDVELGFDISHEQHHAVGYHPRFSFSNLLLSFFLSRQKYIRGNYGAWTGFNNFYVNGKAYGGLVGNVRGLARYLQLYLTHTMFHNPETQQLMFAEQKGGMALSWYTGALLGNPYVCHAGGGGGYYGEIRIYPGLNLASAVLRNKSGFSDQRLLDKIDNTIIFNN